MAATALGQKEVKGLFEVVTGAVDGSTKLLAKGVSAAGQRAKDNYDTRQQRGILGALYAAAQEDDGIKDLMQSSDVQNILDVQER